MLSWIRALDTALDSYGRFDQNFENVCSVRVLIMITWLRKDRRLMRGLRRRCLVLLRFTEMSWRAANCLLRLTRGILIGDRTCDPTDISIVQPYDGAGPDYGGIFGTSGKEPIYLTDDSKRTFVMVTLGQSLAANFAAARYGARHAVLNFNAYDGKCYRAIDPLVGASGGGANFATRLGDILIERGFAERIVIAPIGMGNTRVEDWSSKGVFNQRIQVLIRRLFDARIIPDAILWQQGEGNVADDDPGGRNYCRHLLEVVQTFRKYRISAPFLIALSAMVADPPPTIQNVRAGQRAAVRKNMGTFLGPDTDCIGYEDRFDRVHMSESGVCKQAEMWADSIMRLFALLQRF
jgi:Carbohydrate esterase, sialic acid-specific acetylesterase